MREFEGHTVVRANHLGDWGTQFGMLTQHMLDNGVEHVRGIREGVPEIKRADRALFTTERRAFSSESREWPELEGVERLELELEAWPPDQAVRVFLERFVALDARRR